MKKMMIALTIACGIGASNINAGWFGDAWDSVTDFGSSVVSGISGAVSGAINTVKGVAGNLLGGGSSDQKLIDKMTNDVEQYNTAAQKGDTKEARRQYDQLVDRLGQLKDANAINAFAPIIDQIKTGNGW